jgi:cytidine deaminase
MVDLATTPLGAALDRRLLGPGSVAMISAHELDELARASGLARDALLLACLPWAERWAHPPISHFRVGALALGGSGTLYCGANIEFEGLPLCETIHAEQAAILHAWLGGEASIDLLATSAAPCGFCRQFMVELPEPRPQIVMPGRPPASVDELLPAHFGPEQLGRTPTALRAGPHALRVIGGDANDPLVAATLAAAQRASVPYSGTIAAVGLETGDGRCFAAATLESVAYNPTLGPAQAAVIALHLQGGRLAEVRRALLLELAGGMLHHGRSAAQILASFAAGVRLQVLELEPA